jgi:hypothetical protein
MMTHHARSADDYADDIAAALTTKGGHLFVSSGGASLYSRNGRLSGCNIMVLKAACIAAGLPVIDSRCIDDEPGLWLLAVDVPMVAVGQDASATPWKGAVSYAPLEYVAGLYRAAGAEVYNVPEAVAPTTKVAQAREHQRKVMWARRSLGMVATAPQPPKETGNENPP